MSLSVQIGLLFALATAVTSIVGFLLKYRGADESPAVELSRPISSSLALFQSRTYTIGIIVATASWGLHVAALALAPISLVQSVIAGGLALLTVDRRSRLRPERDAPRVGLRWRSPRSASRSSQPPWRARARAAHSDYDARRRSPCTSD